MGYFDWVFGLGIVFCIWDAIGCGANDVANSFATAVNSKTLTMQQAMVIATAMELLGALTLGANNANTIRGSIIQTAPFAQNGGALMFGMLCVVISSSTFNFLSNRFGWATSSTHAMIGALIGLGVSSGAGVQWGYVVTTTNGAVSGQNGLGAVVASFFISPVLAGLIAAIVYGMVRFIVLERKGTLSFTYALRSAPFWYAFVAAFQAWLITWKTPRFEKMLSDEQTIAVFFGMFCSVGLLTYVFIVPYIRRTTWLGWKALHLYHIPLMPMSDEWLIKNLPGCNVRSAYFDDRHLRGVDIPESEAWQWTEGELKALWKARELVKANAASLELPEAAKAVGSVLDSDSPMNQDPNQDSLTLEAPAVAAEDGPKSLVITVRDTPAPQPTTLPPLHAPASTPSPHAHHTPKSPSLAPGISPKLGATEIVQHNPMLLKSVSHPVLLDHTEAFVQREVEESAWKKKKAQFKKDMTSKDKTAWEKTKIAAHFVFFIGVDREIADYGMDEPEIAALHEHATKYYGKTEMVFRFLQALTSSVASFAHGANDVGLSVGPIATMYFYWQNGGRVPVPRSSVVLDWQLAVGACSLVLGLWFYGYNMMRVLGNRLTFHSPSRGFSMEMGAAITVLIAARNGIPVSTTNCIVGATMGVGLLSEGVNGVNWKLFFFTMFTWLYTLPFTGLMTGLIYAFATHSPPLTCQRMTVNPLGGEVSINGANFTSTQTIWPAGC